MPDPVRTTEPTDPPATGAGRELRVRRPHPHAGGPDPLTARLHFLLRTYPGVVRFRADDLAALDAETKALLVGQIDEALGLDAPAPPVLPFDGPD